MICPIRKGGPCVGSECAWYGRSKCAVLEIAVWLYSIGKTVSEKGNINFSVIDDDDIPF